MKSHSVTGTERAVLCHASAVRSFETPESFGWRTSRSQHEGQHAHQHDADGKHCSRPGRRHGIAASHGPFAAHGDAGRDQREARADPRKESALVGEAEPLVRLVA